MNYIPYSRQLIDKKDKKLTNSLSNNLITTGPLVKKFENEIKNILNAIIVLFVVVELLQFI